MKEAFNTRFDFDLVLLDLQAPVLDGLECVTRYRAFERDQMTKLARHLSNKRKNDTVKLLLHSNYFRVNYASNLTTSSSNFNIDNFKYLDNTADKVDKMESERYGGSALEDKDKRGDSASKRSSYGDKLINVPDGFDCDENNHDGGNNYNRSISGSNYGVNSYGGTLDNSTHADSTDYKDDNMDGSKEDEETERKPAGIRFTQDSYDTFNRWLCALSAVPPHFMPIAFSFISNSQLYYFLFTSVTSSISPFISNRHSPCFISFSSFSSHHTLTSLLFFLS